MKSAHKNPSPPLRSRGSSMMSEAEIDYNVMGTFPASDPPSWTLGIRPNKARVTEFEGGLPSTHDPSHQNEPPGSGSKKSHPEETSLGD